tara:strand:+ start:785 stop:1636 length:852 start_codon:yes stop_codon:yes gene_type:complete
MNIANIIIIIILILIIIWLLNKVFFSTNIVYDKILNANKLGSSGANSTNDIPNSDLKEENTSNFMLSVWFYIDDWASGIDNEKNILFMAKNETVTNIDGLTKLTGLTKTTTCMTNVDDIPFRNLNICLDKYDNNLLIDIETYGENRCRDTPHAPPGSSNSIVTRHKISNIPLQKWNCLILSVDTKTFDIYLDGKLRNSFILDGTYKNNGSKKNIYLGNVINGVPGFEGFITRVRYEANSINPQQAYKIYKDGINASMLNSLFNQYSLKVSFLEFNKEKGSFTI